MSIAQQNNCVVAVYDRIIVECGISSQSDTSNCRELIIDCILPVCVIENLLTHTHTHTYLTVSSPLLHYSLRYSRASTTVPHSTWVSILPQSNNKILSISPLLTPRAICAPHTPPDPAGKVGRHVFIQERSRVFSRISNCFFPRHARQMWVCTHVTQQSDISNHWPRSKRTRN